MQSFIRWAGSKRMIIGELLKLCPPKFGRYFEPFSGSACLYFALSPRQAVLGDINTDLTTTYRSIQNDPDLVIECLKRIPISKSSYYKLRKTKLHELTPNEIAARFLYLNQYCFNGLYRTNLKGSFNVPFAENRLNTKIDEEKIIKAGHQLRNASIINDDFESTLKYTQKNDFVYIDPPYAINSKRIFSSYHPKSFTLSDLNRLKSLLLTLDQKGVKFLLSYQDSSEARDLLKPWKTKRIWTRRNIAGFAGSRQGVFEITGTNY